MGALISPEHMHKVDSMVQRAKESEKTGLICLTGGNVMTEHHNYDFSRGSFYPPTILSLQSPSMEKDMRKSEIWRQEVFGPVVVCCPFRDENHALELANDCEYSLGASVWTKDVSVT
jgi:acyl-CoA reductase-like NAD-dependent aldehyde dehydrogenase